MIRPPLSLALLTLWRHRSSHRHALHLGYAGIPAVVLLCAGCGDQRVPPPEPAPIAVAMHAPEPLPDAGDSGLVRVSLVDRAADSVTIRTACRVDVFDQQTGQRVTTFPRAAVRAISRTQTGWSLSGTVVTAGPLELRPEKSPGLWINDRLYRGQVRLAVVGDQRIRPINIVPLEHYLVAVVDGEMPATFPAAARQAQAIVARTYAAMQRQSAGESAEFDVYASPSRGQNYLGVEYRDDRGRALAGESDSARRAVASTRGLVCTRDGRLFCTYYSACCGGRTTQGALLFSDAAELPSVNCDRCRNCPRYRWSTALSDAELAKAISQSGARARSGSLRGSVLTTTGVDDRDHLPQMTFRDQSSGDVAIDPLRLQAALGTERLPSAWFNIRRNGDGFLVEGRGHGHGVGLCQWGAAGFAEDGEDVRSILARYYPGARLGSVSSVSTPAGESRHESATVQHSDD